MMSDTKTKEGKMINHDEFKEMLAAFERAMAYNRMGDDQKADEYAAYLVGLLLSHNILTDASFRAMA